MVKLFKISSIQFQEISGELNPESFPSEKVLVLTSDDRTASQLQDLLRIGPRNLLTKMFNRMYGEKHGKLTEQEEKDSSGDADCVILFHSMMTDEDSFDLFRLLHEVKPAFVVMYDSQVSAVRQLEVMQAANPSINVKVSGKPLYCYIHCYLFLEP